MYRATRHKPKFFDWSHFQHPVILERTYPNWHKLHTIFKRSEFLPQNVCDLICITNRQINEWEGRGYLGCERTQKGGWRRFRALDLFAFAILADLKRAGFHISLLIGDGWLGTSFADDLWCAV